MRESKEAGEVSEARPEGQRHERERGRRKCVGGSNANNYLIEKQNKAFDLDSPSNLKESRSKFLGF